MEDDRPEPTPGITAPLDEVTEEEEELEPVGVMPGAGPDEEPNRAEKETGTADEGGGDAEDERPS
jgi:hypothetical protein